MRCLATGGSGFVGSHLVRLLVEQGHEVGVLLRSAGEPWRIRDVLDRVRIIRGDLATLGEVRESVERFAPDGVFHLAWHGVREPGHDVEEDSNVRDGLALVELARQCACRFWVGVGSQAEYGMQRGVRRETSPTQPQPGYGVSKLSLAHAARDRCGASGIRFVWLRLFATYGPTDGSQRLIPYVITSLLHGRRPVLSAGEQRWDYLYVEDAARALEHVATHAHAQGIYNLAYGEAAAVRSIVERIRDLIDPRVALRFGDLPYHPGPSPDLEADVSRLKQTGWSPRIPLSEGLQRTVEWFRAHGERGARAPVSAR